MSNAIINGTILDAADNPLLVLITFTPLLAPFIDTGGKVISPQAVQIKSKAADGTFTVTLEAGSYTVTYATTPAFSFSITVPSTGTFTIDQLVVTFSVPQYSMSGAGSPNGVMTAPFGSTYWDTVGLTFYVKNSPNGNTGWLALVQQTL
jgi:hypothetical protein